MALLLHFIALWVLLLCWICPFDPKQWQITLGKDQEARLVAALWSLSPNAEDLTHLHLLSVVCGRFIMPDIKQVFSRDILGISASLELFMGPLSQYIIVHKKLHDLF